jgi:hypothetical protein
VTRDPERLLPIAYRGVSQAVALAEAEGDAPTIRVRGLEPEQQSWTTEGGVHVLTVFYRPVDSTIRPNESGVTRQLRVLVIRPFVGIGVVIWMAISASLLLTGDMPWWLFVISLCCLPLVGIFLHPGGDA